jgi:hypothetical protein
MHHLLKAARSAPCQEGTAGKEGQLAPFSPPRFIGGSPVADSTLSWLRFTGQMASAAFNVDDKETIVKEYAAKHGIDLGKSHAYGDSIADLRMLESVRIQNELFTV